jgi:hypothetical protein
MISFSKNEFFIYLFAVAKNMNVGEYGVPKQVFPAGWTKKTG